MLSYDLSSLLRDLKVQVQVQVQVQVKSIVASSFRQLSPCLCGALALIGLLAGSSAMAAIDLSLLRQRNPQFDWRALDKGDVVWREIAEAEVDEAGLATMMAVKLPADINSVLEELQQDLPGTENLLLDVRSGESVRESLNSFSLPFKSLTDLEWFYHPVADGTFNATRNELALLQGVAQESRDGGLNQQQSRTAIEVAVRDLLASRVNEYRTGGLAAISAYDIDGKQIHPGDYLANSLQPLKLLQEEEGDFYRAFIDYPRVLSSGYDQQFYVTSETESGRPLTSLKHWMVERRDGFVLIAERKFYISHSLDAMHTLILLLEEEGQCYVFLVNQSFTQKVTGFGSFIAHKVGRNKVKQNILPLFQGLKAAFP